jgi:hypothetical protein
MMAVDVNGEPGTPGSLGSPHVVFEQRYDSGNGVTAPDYDVSADGQRFLMVKNQSGTQLHMVLNWFEELKRLTATK